MRKDTWFRGPLLSVLFFGLMIGGVPTMATADLKSVSSALELLEGPCQNGGVYTDRGCLPFNEVQDILACETSALMAAGGGAVALLGGLGAMFSGAMGVWPITLLSAGASAIGAFVGVVGVYQWVDGECWKL